MRKIIIIAIFGLLFNGAYAQQTLHIGEVTLKDTLNGQLLLKDGAFPADLYSNHIYTNFLTIDGGLFVSEDAICSEEGRWEFMNEVHFDTSIIVTGEIISSDIYMYGTMHLDTGAYSYGEFSPSGLTFLNGNIIVIDESGQTLDEADPSGLLEGDIIALYFASDCLIRSGRESSGIGFQLPDGDWSVTAGDILTLLYIDGYLRQLSRTDF